MSWGRVFFGGVIVGVGVILLLANADLVDAGEAFGWFWPAVLIFAGVLSFFANARHWVAAAFLVGLGAVFLLSRAGLVDAFDLIIPAALIVIGLVVLLGRGVTGHQADVDVVNSFNIFSGSELRSTSQSFKGGNITVIFGGSELDLRQASLAPGARLDCIVAFGGAEIKVPDGWHVVVKGLPIFGAVENKVVAASENAPTLEVSSTVLFGGIEIRT